MAAFVVALAVLPFGPAVAQRADSLADTLPRRVVPLAGVTVTATRAPREVFHTPAPIIALDTTVLRARAALSISDLVAESPGLDVEGVGLVRRHPVIRGLQGQRVLLLEDGIRLNNPRREVDRSEPLSIVDPDALVRVEVLRGPASVLYGSDAIGGVVNLVTAGAPAAAGPAWGGAAHLGGATLGGLREAAGMLQGRLVGTRFRVGGSLRDMAAYSAPAGRFGEVVLPATTPVHDSGVRDERWNALLAGSLGPHGIFLRHESYVARGSGFGYVDPVDYGSAAPRVRIHIPDQRSRRTSAGFRGAAPGSNLFADRLDVTLFRHENDRDFVTEVASRLARPPGARLSVVTESFTSVATVGARVEARKLAPGMVLLTYGVDAARDRSTSTDTSTTTVFGSGPPSVAGRGTSRVPNATLATTGWFAQAERGVLPSTDLTAGVRYQRAEARTRPTSGQTQSAETHRDDALVGALSVLHRLSARVNLIGSVARGFRSPNLVERFYAGPTPEGRGLWIRNPGLGPERSLSVDVGARFRADGAHLEAFAYQNTLHHGIRLASTGREVDGLREYRNENVDGIRLRGMEVSGGARLPLGLSLAAWHALVRASNVSDPGDPPRDIDRDRSTVALRLGEPGGPRWVEYSVRSTGARSELEPGVSPVGERVPGYRVHDLRGGVRRGGAQQLVVEVRNLTDLLYADAENTNFFRPAPGRTLAVRWSVRF